MLGQGRGNGPPGTAGNESGWPEIYEDGRGYVRTAGDY